MKTKVNYSVGLTTDTGRASPDSNKYCIAQQRNIAQFHLHKLHYFITEERTRAARYRARLQLTAKFDLCGAIKWLLRELLLVGACGARTMTLNKSNPNWCNSQLMSTATMGNCQSSISNCRTTIKTCSALLILTAVARGHRVHNAEQFRHTGPTGRIGVGNCENFMNT